MGGVFARGRGGRGAVRRQAVQVLRLRWTRSFEPRPSRDACVFAPSDLCWRATCRCEETATLEVPVSHEQFSDCIDACNDCAAACEHCADACLGEDDVAMMADCIRLDRDCADICRLAVALMERNSRFAGELCGLCATVCEACAAECSKHKAAHCRACADACQRCAAACRAMAS